MYRDYKYRLYPNLQQRVLLDRTFSAVKFVYNDALDYCITAYKYGFSLGVFWCLRSLTILKSQNKWLQTVDSIALKNSIWSLNDAYKGFFEGRTKYPKFKHKHDKNFFTTNNNTKRTAIRIVDNKIKIPKIGKIKASISREISGEIIKAYISKTPTNKYFVSLICRDAKKEKEIQKGSNYIGIDLGIKTFATLSNGEKVENPSFLDKEIKKIVYLDKVKDRKTKNSENFFKVRKRINLLYEKITNKRRDFLQKLSTEIIKKYDIISVEKLSISDLTKKNRISGKIYDASFYSFRKMLEYKAKENGKFYVEIDTFFPSSQICSNCGYRNKRIKNLKFRTWICPECNTEHDRDINAAKNILNEGLKILNIV